MKKGQKWQAASQHSLADTGDSYRHTLPHTHTHTHTHTQTHTCLHTHTHTNTHTHDLPVGTDGWLQFVRWRGVCVCVSVSERNERLQRDTQLTDEEERRCSAQREI